MTAIILTAIGGLLVGLVIGYLAAARRGLAQLGQLQGELTATKDRTTQLDQQIVSRDQKIESLNQELARGQEQLGRFAQQIQDQQNDIAEQKKILDDAKQKLQDTFKALATDALKVSKEDFLQLAKQSIESMLNQAKGDMGKHKEQIDALMKPLRETLTNYQKELQEIEKSRNDAYGGLRKHLEELTKTQVELQGKTGELATALKNPKVGGKWGELTLHRTAELAGMTEYCDFEEQFSMDADEGKLRPDMVVKLPGGRTIAVDSKLSYQSYIDAINATDDNARNEAMRRYSQAVRQHVVALSSKSYWDQFKDRSVEFVVLFLPGESFFSAAVTADQDLIDYAIKNKVMLSSPTTLISLLKAISFGWRQEKLAANAEEIRKLGREFYDRMTTFVQHLADVGSSLNKTVSSYNKAMGSLETRLVPTARKFNELGVGEAEKLPDVSPLDQSARQLPPGLFSVESE
jgi:DNA recombination protein RmuC